MKVIGGANICSQLEENPHRLRSCDSDRTLGSRAFAKLTGAAFGRSEIDNSSLSDAQCSPIPTPPFSCLLKEHAFRDATYDIVRRDAENGVQTRSARISTEADQANHVALRPCNQSTGRVVPSNVQEPVGKIFSTSSQRASSTTHHP
jgi:hypothetical protein